MTCNDCKWFGVEEKKKYKMVYCAVTEAVKTIYYTEEVRVCNYNCPSTELDTRTSPCNNYETKISQKTEN